MLSTTPTVHTWPLDRPLDVRRTLAFATMWGASPWVIADRTGGWFADRTPDGPGTVWIRAEGSVLRARAWGPGGDRLIARVPRLVGLHDPGAGIIRTDHPRLRDVVRRRRAVRLATLDDLFPRLITVALAQKVTGKNSKAAARALAWRWGEPAPGPRRDLRLMPTAEALLAQPSWAYHPLNIEGHRASLVRRIARHAASLERAAVLPLGEARAHLQKLHGIGPWTSAVVAGASLGDPDAVPVGDAKLPHVVVHSLTGADRGDDATMLEVLAPFAGQRGRVARLLKTGGARPPRFGPKTTVRDIRGH